MQKIELFKDIARNINEFVIDAVPTGMTGTTVDIPALIHNQNSQLKGSFIFVYAGAGASANRTVATFDPANNRLCVEQPFSAIGSTNTSVIVFKDHDGDEYESSFVQAYSKFYFTRTNLRDKWAQWTSAITQRQAQWAAERTSEQAAFVSDMATNQTRWNEAQTKWENLMTAEWKAFISTKLIGNAMRVPSLHISTAGTMLIGTLPVGSLYVGTISLASVPSPSIGSYGGSVPDEPLLTNYFEMLMLQKKLGDDTKWATRYSTVVERYNNQLNSESVMVDNLIKNSEDMWSLHKAEFNNSWQNHKDKMTSNLNAMMVSYEQYKADVEKRWADIKANA